MSHTRMKSYSRTAPGSQGIGRLRRGMSKISNWRPGGLAGSSSNHLGRLESEGCGRLPAGVPCRQVFGTGSSSLKEVDDRPFNCGFGFGLWIESWIVGFSSNDNDRSAMRLSGFQCSRRRSIRDQNPKSQLSLARCADRGFFSLDRHLVCRLNANP
jgi:hypothetical protein